MKQLYFLLFILFLWSCQTEEFFESVEENTSLSSQSELSNLISRLNQNPTAFDDFIDNSNSFSLEFPFEVTVNSENTFIIEEFDDYQPLIDELSTLSEDYTITIGFPVEISLPNYESLNVQSESELEAIEANVEGSIEINCLEYNFPLDVNIFDVENSLTDRRSIQNKAQFFNLIQNLKQNNGFYQIVYPVTISIDGSNQSISSNVDLEAAIENLDAACFDPSLFINSASGLQQFIAFVTSGEFRVTQFIDVNGDDETDDYENFVFTFNSNNTISIVNTTSGDTFTADWQAEIDDDELVFELDLEDLEEFEDLDEDWIVLDFANPDQIELRYEDGDDGGESFLTFEKI